MKNKILTIGFEGLHRAGKGTQIKMFSKYLIERGIPSLITRGDGSRAGMNLAPYDLHSTWWQGNLAYFKQEPISIGEKKEKADIKYQRLNREAKIIGKRTLPNLMRKENKNLGVMLMDRTFISRFFFCKQIDSTVSLDESLKVYDPNNRQVEIIMPDLTFILDAPKETLLNRISKEECNPEKCDFKTKIISSHYDLFNETCSELRDRKNVYLINATNSLEEIHQEVLKYCKPFIFKNE